MIVLRTATSTSMIYNSNRYSNSNIVIVVITKKLVSNILIIQISDNYLILCLIIRIQNL